jgi:GNAT superfamily N-acetyltransferase
MAGASWTGVVIRRAVVADAAAVSRLFAQLGYDVDEAQVARRIAELEVDTRSRVLVAVNEEGVVGAATIYFVPVAHQAGPWCRITALVVDERVRARGVGRALVAAAEDAAAQAGCARIEATSALRRENAHRFYERLGYSREANHFLKLLSVGHSATR